MLKWINKFRVGLYMAIMSFVIGVAHKGRTPLAIIGVGVGLSIMIDSIITYESERNE